MPIPREVVSNPVTTDPKGESVLCANTPALAKQNMTMDPSWITGFTDGEGCFSISINFRSKLKTGIEVRPSFSISQNVSNLSTLQEIQEFFGVGKIRFSKRDSTYKYEVRSLANLCEIIIPHFEKYPLLTSKRFDYEIFSDICNQMQSGFHYKPQTLRKIIEKTNLMNPSGKRRINQGEFLRYMSKVKI